MAAEVPFTLEKPDREEIFSYIKNNLKSEPWNDEVKSIKSFVIKHEYTSHIITAVEILFEPAIRTRIFEVSSEVLCSKEPEGWDCWLESRRKVFAENANTWMSLGLEIAEDEAIDFAQSLKSDTVFYSEEYDFEIRFPQFEKVSISYGEYDEGLLSIYGTHFDMGSIMFKIDPQIDGNKVPIRDFMRFFQLCDDGSMQYGYNACRTDT